MVAMVFIIFLDSAVLRLEYGRLEYSGAGGQRDILKNIRERGPIGLRHLTRGKFRKRFTRQVSKAVGV